MVDSSEVDAGNLQVAAVDVALMKRYIAIHHDPLDSSAAHGIVLTMHGGDGIICRHAGEPP